MDVEKFIHFFTISILPQPFYPRRPYYFADLGDVLVIIRSQDYKYHRNKAEVLKKNLLEQAKKISNEEVSFVFSSHLVYRILIICRYFSAIDYNWL